MFTTDVASPAIDFDHFHREELPARLATGTGALAARDLVGVAPLAFELSDGRAVTYVPQPDGVALHPGVTEDAGAVIVLDPGPWSEFVQELRTSFGLLYAGLVHARTGTVEQLIRWEPALRAMFHGRPVYDPDELDFRDRQGRPLELARSFSLQGGPADGDTLADLRHFIHQTGFAHVRGVVDADDLAPLVAEVERLQGLARPGDDRSWWARRSDGTDVVCRLTYVNDRSEVLARAHELPPLQTLVDAVAPDGAELAVFSDRNDGHSVVIKNHDVVDGLSDLPWHIDCGLGGHPVLCPTVLIGVQLTAASSSAGQLQFLAGSWRASCHQLTADEIASGRYPVVAIDAEPGDITMHFGHGMHVAPPPAGADGCRRTLYLGWNNVACGDVVPAGSGYNDVVLRSGEDNRVLSVPEQLAKD